MKKKFYTKRLMAGVLALACILSGCGGASNAPSGSKASSAAASTTGATGGKITQPVLPEDDASKLVPVTGDDGIDASGIKTEYYDSAFVAGDAAYEYSNLGEELANQYATAIKGAKSILGDKTTIYDLIVPTAMDVTLPDAIRKNVEGTNTQKDSIAMTYKAIGDAANCIDIIDILRQHKKEYLYFKTDHHWTARAGYYAYREFCKKKGIQANSLYDYKKIDFDKFQGSYLNHLDAEALKTSYDTVEAFVPLSTNAMVFTDESGKETNWQIITDVSDWATGSKYNAFIGGDNPVSTITNPNIKDGSSLLVIKESFGNAVVPFFVDHYQYVYVIDYRYYNGTLSEFAKEHKLTDMLFITAISAGMGNIDSLEDFLK